MAQPARTYVVRLNPLLSEAVFSISRARGRRHLGRARLNPLLSEAVFSMGAQKGGENENLHVLILF